MEIEFRDKTLALVETDQAPETRLPVAVINSLRDKLVFLRAAPDERSLPKLEEFALRKDGRGRTIHSNKQAISTDFCHRYRKQAQQDDDSQSVEPRLAQREL
jgi:plasmid maintenance system killer protein